VIVTNPIIRPQRPPIEITDGRYQVSDVGMDGVSIAFVQRSEFAAVIKRSGGRVASLFATTCEAI
jgi:ABC-type transporter MlaC component